MPRALTARVARANSRSRALRTAPCVQASGRRVGGRLLSDFESYKQTCGCACSPGTQLAQERKTSCSFVGGDGRRCSATRSLENSLICIRGPSVVSTVREIRVALQSSQCVEAVRDFGDSHVANKRKHVSKPLRVREPMVRYVARVTTQLPSSNEMSFRRR